MIRTYSKFLTLLVAMGVMAGCSSTATQDEGYGSDVSAVDQEGGSEVYGGEGSDGVSSSTMTDDERAAQAEQSAQREQASMRKVTTFYFDFDTSEIKPEARDVLIAHAQYLSNNPSARARLEGHGDERGTKEYNLALGERRAKSVERFLVVNGASRDQIETISYGEEKPATMGSGESAYAQNRRVELIYQ
ncbi:peptidoglycan-associated lipoprotein Pal [Marinobacter fonticola]|uniref:peptidoglycan-associated lipoprotein Pal n=1 Tax=Marinobacter fonticola TaxID=2603215 RepID=UPI0011E82F0C|nr:peptidoglycan-associated lipoprotein Pal [Marinobacter fonticola]